MRIRVTLTYDYDVNPEHYPGCENATQMAELDIDSDPAVILSGDNYNVSAQEIPDKEFEGSQV